MNYGDMYGCGDVWGMCILYINYGDIYGCGDVWGMGEWVRGCMGHMGKVSM